MQEVFEVFKKHYKNFPAMVISFKKKFTRLAHLIDDARVLCDGEYVVCYDQAILASVIAETEAKQAELRNLVCEKMKIHLQSKLDNAIITKNNQTRNQFRAEVLSVHITPHQVFATVRKIRIRNGVEKVSEVRERIFDYEFHELGFDVNVL